MKRSQKLPYTTLTTEKFTEKAKAKHGSRYDYTNVRYVNSRSKVLITCGFHGDFEQTPNNHLMGTGCPKCEKENKARRNRERRCLTTETFVERAEQIYGERFDYSATVYMSSWKPVTIVCLLHGSFTIARAEKHLYGQACPQCSVANSQAELIIARTLDELHIKYEQQKKFEDCRSPFSNRKLSYDFYIPSQLLLEYDGEQHTKKSPLFHVGDRFERMKVHDAVKTRYAVDAGFTLIRLSTRDFPYLTKLVASLVST